MDNGVNMQTLLKISNISKEYEKVVALDNVSLEIEKGTVFGLLGPNGAGKTSLIRILTGITLPDKGSFSLNETGHHDFNQISRMIGYLPEERGLYPDMKVIDQLEFFGRIKGLSKKETHQKIDFYCKKLEIDGWLGKKARELSKGMQQLVQFVACIFYEPSLIILDEPFTGLDPINSLKLQNEILELKNEGKTIIFSTHRMEQVEEFCQNIALINKGNIILEGNLQEIKNRFKENIYEIKYIGECGLETCEDYEVISPSWELGDRRSELNTPLSTLYSPLRAGGTIRIKDLNHHSSANILLKKILQQIEVVSFTEVLPSLSEIFIESVSALDMHFCTKKLHNDEKEVLNEQD